MAYLAHIFIYPLKALDPMSLESGTILTSGAIAHDREWALFDADGKFVNGKNNELVHLIRSSLDRDFNTLTLQIQNTQSKAVFQLQQEQAALESWLSDYFNFPVHLKQNTATGYPDDTYAPGPTLISTATIKTVADWFPGISVEEMRLRLRANLEIDGVPPFWEDRLFDRQDRGVEFQIGKVKFTGINPCKRCIVPTREPHTGKGYPNFTKIFITKRRETLPNWANRQRFNHFYRLSVNTKVPPSEAGKILRIGDRLSLEK